MPRQGNSNLFRCFLAWRLANNICHISYKKPLSNRQGLFLAGLIYGFLCRVTETAPPPTPSLKKGGGVMAVSVRGAWQTNSAESRTIKPNNFIFLPF